MSFKFRMDVSHFRNKFMSHSAKMAGGLPGAPRQHRGGGVWCLSQAPTDEQERLSAGQRAVEEPTFHT